MTSIEEKLKEKVGVTFNGSVTFNGPMFDIHDNEVVNLSVDKAGKVKDGDNHTVDHGADEGIDVAGDLLALLRPMFYGSEDNAKDFLSAIRGMKPTQITAEVNRLVAANKLSTLSRKRDLWRVLHDNGLYSKSENNWNMQVK